ncbi:hybrid sensor histidine kinase/response regulator [Massilia sp. CCM 8734]|uniref:ATP-binding response regulator n=1 Tax=Massilia sp. CCM 8734 TaxID=2609283 RepID=UPI00141F63FA|nr:hybrid sensor histidine kinase/response regulator [Massilia sp. CCM 8734]NHZ99072.1 response regulator [Massilia sp. CCM 8734]
MIRLIRENWSKFAAFSAVAAVATTGMAYYSHGLLVSPAQLDATTGPNEGYYWTVAQYQIQFERLDNQIVRYATGMDRNVEALKLRHHVLQSKFHVLSSQSMLTDFFVQGVPVYRESVGKLGTFMDHVDKDLEGLSKQPELVGRLVGRFDEMRETVNELSNAVRFAEMRHREATLEDFTAKRSKLFAFVMVLWGMFIVGIGLYMLNYFRAKYLISQNEASILAERKAEAALADAIFTKNTILGTISHELKTPLQTIISSIDLMVQRMVSTRDLEVVERLTSAAARLEAQMEDLTDYARLGAGRLDLRRVVFDPGELLERVVDEFKGQAVNGGLDLVLRRKKTVLQVASDARRFEQIATNLITNAIKYTPTGRIQVSLDLVTRNGNELHLVVEDTGPGISPDKIPFLFEPFTQLDQSRTRKYDGAGMGLAIVQRLVDLFGGKIDVHSIIGRGTRFEVVLPVEVISGGVPGPEIPRMNIPGHHRILLVDDNAEVRVSVKDVLTELAYVCDVADSGKVALQKLATHSYDAILLDISMPGMDGFEVAAAVRATSGKNQHIPIVALSAYSPDVAHPEQRVPFSAHLAKPVRMGTLRNIMDDVLGRGI